MSDDLEAEGHAAHVASSAAWLGGLAREQSKIRTDRLGGSDNGEVSPQ